MLATADERYPLSTPQPGWSEQDPEDWWQAAQACLARLPEGAIGLSGQMHGLVALDAGERVLRPAILWNDQRTRAECAEIEAPDRPREADRADREPGADRLHRAEAALAAHARAGDVRADPAGPAAEGLRPPPPDGRARDRRRGRLGDAAASTSAGRRWSEEVCAALEIPLEWLPPVFESTEIGGAGDQAAGGARSGHHRARARSPWCSGPPGSCSPCSRRTPRTPRRACTSSATPCPEPGTRWA